MSKDAGFLENEALEHPPFLPAPPGLGTWAAGFQGPC